MNLQTIVVESLISTDPDDDLDLRGDDAWGLALDQRAFGPRRLVVAFANPFGRLLGLAHAPRTDPTWYAMACCLDHFGPGPAAAIVYCDEPVTAGPPPSDLRARFEFARRVACNYDVHLIDWFACDDDMFRSSRIALDPDGEWWDVPA
jgi:hypothetical protein